MRPIQLLIATVDPSSASEASRSSGLVHIPRSASPAKLIPQDGTAYPSDNFVWTVSVGDNGAFNFYATPNQSNDRTSRQSQSSQQSSAIWDAPLTSDVSVKYVFYAALTIPSTGQYINVYA